MQHLQKLVMYRAILDWPLVSINKKEIVSYVHFSKNIKQ